MSETVAVFFLVFATLSLTAALVALWQSLRAALGVSALEDVQGEGDLDTRRALLSEKDALLQSIRDLEFDREADKIAEPDFRSLDRSLRRRAKDVMRRLDEDVAAERPRAEAMIADYLAEHAVPEAAGASAAADTVPAAKPPEERPACAACGTRNDADASFCKKCGARLAAAEESR